MSSLISFKSKVVWGVKRVSGAEATWRFRDESRAPCRQRILLFFTPAWAVAHGSRAQWLPAYFTGAGAGGLAGALPPRFTTTRALW